MGQREVSISKLLPSEFERLGLPENGLPSKSGFNCQGSSDPPGKCKPLWKQQCELLCFLGKIHPKAGMEKEQQERSCRTVMIKHSVLHWYPPWHWQNSGEGENVKPCCFVPNKSSQGRPGKSGSFFAEQSRQGLCHLGGAGSAAVPGAPGERPHRHAAPAGQGTALYSAALPKRQISSCSSGLMNKKCS